MMKYGRKETSLEEEVFLDGCWEILDELFAGVVVDPV